MARKNEVVIYFPFDISSITEKAVSKINPRLFITVDTEIWPNMIRTLSKRNIPMALINGRISDRSFNGYLFLKPILKGTFERVDLFCMQTEVDYNRVEALGARPESAFKVGNIKFDSALKLEKDIDKIKDKYKGSVDFDKYKNIFIAGSTHHGEEEMAARVFLKLKGDFKDLVLFIAPRHVDRCTEIKNIFEKDFKLKTKLFSELKNTDNFDVLIIDKIGVLKDMYAFSTIAFVGGSLVKHGGHNILEPAFYGKPIIFGRHVFNFRDITELFLKNSASIVVDDENNLYLASLRLLNMEKERLALGRRARSLIDENIGASNNAIFKIKILLNDKNIRI